MPTILLREMQKEPSGTSAAVKVGGELGRRLRDMGMGRAPLSDPVAIRIMGHTLTLPTNEADPLGGEVVDPGADL